MAKKPNTQKVVKVKCKVCGLKMYSTDTERHKEATKHNEFEPIEN